MRVIEKEDPSVADLTEQMQERRPLPMGVPQWDEWSDRIISAALIDADPISLKCALTQMILHLGPTEAFKPDAYFILQLRKAAVNQTAHAMFMKYQEDKRKLAEVTAPNQGDVNGGVLENQTV